MIAAFSQGFPPGTFCGCVSPAVRHFLLYGNPASQTLRHGNGCQRHINLQGAADDSGHRQKDYGHPHNGSPSIQKRPVCSWLCLIPGPDYPKQVQKHQHCGYKCKYDMQYRFEGHFFLSKKLPITEKLVVNQLYPLVNKTVYTGIKK